MSKINLSQRLKCVADNVKSGGIVADIGCDHGFTSIYLVKTGLAKGAVAMDINKEPLLRAEEHICEYGMETYISTRLSDGAKMLKCGEADTLLISGMGGALIVKILNESIEVTKSAKELVLSPQSEVFLVRHFLHENGFIIENEDMVFDQGKYYVVIRAVHGNQHYTDEAGYIYGEYLIQQKNKILKQYLLKEQKRIENILKGFENKALSEEAGKRKILLEDEYKMIMEVLNRISIM